MVNGSLDAIKVAFDDDRSVADAGVLVAATLAGRLGIEALVKSVSISAVALGTSGRDANLVALSWYEDGKPRPVDVGLGGHSSRSS